MPAYFIITIVLSQTEYNASGPVYFKRSCVRRNIGLDGIIILACC